MTGLESHPEGGRSLAPPSPWLLPLRLGRPRAKLSQPGCDDTTPSCSHPDGKQRGLLRVRVSFEATPGRWMPSHTCRRTCRPRRALWFTRYRAGHYLLPRPRGPQDTRQTSRSPRFQHTRGPGSTREVKGQGSIPYRERTDTRLYTCAIFDRAVTTLS